ncbi:MAG: MauE/DoxX family redox-associated membrane protein [Bacteroidota bacterium]
MKRLLSNDALTVALRLLLGILLLAASIGKISQPDAFAQSIANYKILPPPFPMAIATTLPWIELFTGIGLISGFYFRGSSALIVLLFALFMGSVLSALFRNLDIACGCFSQDPEVGKVGWIKILENLGYLLLSIFLFYSKSTKFRLENYLRKSEPVVTDGH